MGIVGLHEQAAGLALVGSSAMFRRSGPNRESEQSDHVLFEQTDDHLRGTEVILEVYAEGILVCRTAIEPKNTPSRSSADNSIVTDKDAVQRTIPAFVAFAGAFYKRRRRDPGSVYLGISMSDIGHKHFGRLPSYPMNTFAVGSPRLDDPLRVPTNPLKITKPQFAKPDQVAIAVVKHIARAFRLEGAYYTP